MPAPTRPASLPRRVVATLTPCPVRAGEIDPSAMAHLCRFLIQKDCDGLFVLGSTGEAPLLDEAQRRSLTVAARQGAGDDAYIFIGATGLGQRQSIQFARNAAADGANSAVLMAPFFLKFSQSQLRDYFTAIADASPIPVALYHHLRCPSAIDPETVAALAAHPNIIALKDTSIDLPRMAELMRLTAGLDIKIYQGVETLVLASLELGAHGSVAALANIIPEWHNDIFRGFDTGDLALARSAQAKVDNLCNLFKEPEMGATFANFLRTMTLPLCQRGVFAKLSTVTGDPSPGFDEWLVAKLAALQIRFTPKGPISP